MKYEGFNINYHTFSQWFIIFHIFQGEKKTEKKSEASEQTVRLLVLLVFGGHQKNGDGGTPWVRRWIWGFALASESPKTPGCWKLESEKRVSLRNDAVFF